MCISRETENSISQAQRELLARLVLAQDASILLHGEPSKQAARTDC